jgi:putative oxidoreductase
MFSRKNNLANLLVTISCLLILLWVYTATSKLTNFSKFERELANQTFSYTTAQILLWLIPTIELIAGFLLLFIKTRFAGLLLSCFLMVLFTGYIALVLLGYYDRVPCSCGGVLKQLGWQAHFWFNLCFRYCSRKEVDKTFVIQNEVACPDTSGKDLLC